MSTFLDLYKVIDFYGLKRKSGEIGIEIEMEGKNLPFIDRGFWTSKSDGSLRGNAVEYILNNPVGRENVRKALQELQTNLKGSGAVLAPSNRCGVHVHMNTLDLTLRQTLNIITLYMVLEDLLVGFCGKERVGNLFCLRVRDAENLLDTIVHQLEQQQFNFNANQYKYAAINLAALSRFGSLEFRSMRTDKDFSSIDTWVNILLRVKDTALQFDNSKQIIEAVSNDGAAFFLDMVMREYGELLDHRKAPELIMEGVRRAQLIAFADVPLMKEEDKGKSLFKKKGAASNIIEEEAVAIAAAGRFLDVGVPPPRVRIATRTVDRAFDVEFPDRTVGPDDAPQALWRIMEPQEQFEDIETGEE